MTPEERAELLCSRLSFFSKADKATGQKAIALAIRAAVAADREARREVRQHVCSTAVKV
jgi:hypothetical protein